MSEVKFKVRYHALQLGDFTIGELVRATGLNPESVRTEVQRLRKAKMVLSAGAAEPGKARGREMRYQVCADPKRRSELFDSVERFLGTREEPSRRPRSRHYTSAKLFIDRALNTTRSERSAWLKRAAEDLEIAYAAEDTGERKELVFAFLDFEGARMEYLRNRCTTARPEFERLQGVFADHGEEEMVSRINEYLFVMDKWSQYNTITEFGAVGWLKTLVAALDRDGHINADPIVASMVTALRRLLAPSGRAFVETALSELQSPLAGRSEVERLGAAKAQKQIRDGVLNPSKAFRSSSGGVAELKRDRLVFGPTSAKVPATPPDTP